MFSNRFYSLLCTMLTVLGVVQLGIPQTASACNLSEYGLDSIVYTGNSYMVYTTLCVGAGVTGTNIGADGDTYTFAFAFYEGCSDDSALVLGFTPANLIADSTNAYSLGAITGPVAGAVNSVGYLPSFGAVWCVSSTAQCGNLHQECNQFTFELKYLPDSIRCLGIEGVNNFNAGCLGADMVIDLSGMPNTFLCTTDTVPPSVSCPPSPTIYMNGNCEGVVPDLSIGLTGFDCCSALLPSQAPAQGALITASQPATLTVSDSSGNSVQCQLQLTLLDTTAPMAVCPTDTIYLDTTSGMATLDAQTVGGGSTDNCLVQSWQVSPSTFNSSQVGANGYTLTVTDSAGNVSTCQGTVWVMDSTMVHVPGELLSQWSIGPVPARQWLKLERSSRLQVAGTATVYNVRGKALHQSALASGQSQFRLSVESLPAGIYLLQVREGEEQAVFRFLKGM